MFGESQDQKLYRAGANSFLSLVFSSYHRKFEKKNHKFQNPLQIKKK